MSAEKRHAWQLAGDAVVCTRCGLRLTSRVRIVNGAPTPLLFMDGTWRGYGANEEQCAGGGRSTGERAEERR